MSQFGAMPKVFTTVSVCLAVTLSNNYTCSSMSAWLANLGAFLAKSSIGSVNDKLHRGHFIWLETNIWQFHESCVHQIHAPTLLNIWREYAGNTLNNENWSGPRLGPRAGPRPLFVWCQHVGHRIFLWFACLVLMSGCAHNINLYMCCMYSVPCAHIVLIANY